MEDGRMLLGNDSLIDILEELRIKIVIGDVSRFTPPINIKKTLNSLYKGNEFLYISRDTKLCYELMENYSVVTGLMKNGMVAEKDRKWNEANISVGKLLGYPETAVLEYVKMFGDLSYIKSGKRRERMARNRYYAHSEKFEDDEFRQYDLPLNQAILKYLPRIAKNMQMDQKRDG